MDILPAGTQTLTCNCNCLQACAVPELPGYTGRPRGSQAAVTAPYSIPSQPSAAASQARRLLPLTIRVWNQQCGDILLILRHLGLLDIPQYLAEASGVSKVHPSVQKSDTEKQQQTAHRPGLLKWRALHSLFGHSVCLCTATLWTMAGTGRYSMHPSPRHFHLPGYKTSQSQKYGLIPRRLQGRVAV